jgi:hypothetical protein
MHFSEVAEQVFILINDLLTTVWNYTKFKFIIIHQFLIKVLELTLVNVGHVFWSQLLLEK